MSKERERARKEKGKEREDWKRIGERRENSDVKNTNKSKNNKKKMKLRT